MTIKQWLAAAEKEFDAAGIHSARLDALIITELSLGQRREFITAHPEKTLSNESLKKLKTLLEQRKNRRPISQISNSKQFFGLDFHIDENVLTPRAESEKIVELAIKLAEKDARLLDIGTGCGAIAVAIAKQRPDLTIFASDISPAALKVARRNAKKHQVDIKFKESDLLKAVGGKFAAIVVNLPYLRDDAELMPEVQHEPAVALLGGDDGLDVYRRLFKQLRRHLEPGGLVLCESDPWQQPDLIKEGEKIGLKPVEQDYFILTLAAP